MPRGCSGNTAKSELQDLWEILSPKNKVEKNWRRHPLSNWPPQGTCKPIHTKWSTRQLGMKLGGRSHGMCKALCSIPTTTNKCPPDCFLLGNISVIWAQLHSSQRINNWESSAYLVCAWLIKRLQIPKPKGLTKLDFQYKRLKIYIILPLLYSIEFLNLFTLTVENMLLICRCVISVSYVLCHGSLYLLFKEGERAGHL